HHRGDRHHSADRYRQEERDHDDRLRARRRARGGQGAAGCHLRSVSAAVSSDPDDDHVGAAWRASADDRNRCRIGAPPSARPDDGWRPDREPGADAVHDARHLSDVRSNRRAIPQVAACPPGAWSSRVMTAAGPSQGADCAPGGGRMGQWGCERGGPLNLSRLFIDRPVATTLLTIGVALAGAIAFRLLPVSPLPQVDFPTISVHAGLPGASPETMSATVATPPQR